MPKQPSEGVGLCEKLDDAYHALSPQDIFRKLVDEMSDQLMENCSSGDQIPKGRIPNYYSRLYGVNNLYRYRFRGGYRGIYTILVIDGGIYCWILDILDHDQYDRRFGYS